MVLRSIRSLRFASIVLITDCETPAPAAISVWVRAGKPASARFTFSRATTFRSANLTGIGDTEEYIQIILSLLYYAMAILLQNIALVKKILTFRYDYVILHLADKIQF